MNILMTAMTIIGCMMLLIYGMSLLSDGMQKVAGDRMRKLFAITAGNPILGVLAGAAAAAVFQSGSLTTVMIVGFVGAGWMKLPQAICFIMGAGIGATLTAQLIAFPLGSYAWGFVMVGFTMFFILKRWEAVHNFGQAMLGFGLLFVGFNGMTGAMEAVVSSPYLGNLMVQLEDLPVMGVFLGGLLALILQSSTAGVALFQSVASSAASSGVSGFVGLSAAIPLVFGFNMGATILPYASSRSMSVDAKRVVLFHLIYTVAATLLFIWFIPQIGQLIQFLSPDVGNGQISPRQLANVHLLFNVAGTLIFLPFTGLFVKLVEFLIPGEGMTVSDTEPLYLDQRVLNQPAFAIRLAIEELLRIGGFALQMLNKSKQAFLDNDLSQIEEVLALESAVDKVQDQTVEYLACILTKESCSDKQARNIADLLKVSSDIEHIGDYCINLIELAQEKNKHKYDFSDRAMAEISDYFDQSIWIVKDALASLEKGDPSLAKDVLVQENQMNQTETRLRTAHMRRLNDSLCSPEFTVIYNEVIHNIEKIGDCSNNIAEMVLDDTGLGLDKQLD